MSTAEFSYEINQMSGMLQAFAYKLTKNFDDSKDLYQETAYRALTNQDKFRHGTNLKAWMFTIMRNIFINNYRKKAKSNTIFDATDNQYYLNTGMESQQVHNAAESTILMQELNGMVDNLDDSIRVPFIMHYYGYKYQEIAEQLDLPLGTVKSRIFFARKELKNVIQERYGNTLDRYL
jgi:RNA polymerase sigma-70 factor (ECF subfamily)